MRWLATNISLLCVLTFNSAAQAQAEGELPPPPPGYGAAQPYPPPAYSPYAPYGGYEPPAPAPPPQEKVRSVSISISPLHLILPVVELTLEVRPVDHLGIAVIGGYGRATFENAGPQDQDVTAKVWELGGQAVYYFSKPFHGLHLGAELLYVHLDAVTSDGGFIQGIARGAAVGPLVGYKVLTSGGFTFVAQGGFEYLFARGETVDATGATSTAEGRDVIVLLNLNIGWSF